ncbi:MAG: ADP-glyceromanno-heptose 6-epimerase [Candidatus Lambdaproteobacteria bacterium RIFOXYD1_FULL_56_27]|uniref:ADP-L-glycero-D-manno-heptose-6-epimerase n=1 Tax=Candidatus Lambdaproteobacteria bacterium RIFOXYD2_FULL_56_26 TaxID=1817773 RepID=A0A1F6H0P2_9PROT|nr:MAG: ADP-glyceromanno-heptose 6-epimerase [Candidatus Lambdaproteobacteria bacterium RIFOXYC1_FULL_56_13]OGH03968.1 MAG: ADP-glyceromanno-heptose 6-epimerase [Candidatus Lambdaproteobacteria bacterium RIFOXYD2_FULL_56_26]OGH08359.1 MAG: ADP-glyceromanno-heptose 6-epimerase [Candidatus Lambdaproteobacteria bacterium RIFOXYD1_FULL_56_27]
MIIVTGGAGFIGSRIIHGLNERGIEDILVVDHLGKTEKYKNLIGLRYADYVEKDEFIDAVQSNQFEDTDLEAILHMGACSATTELDGSYLVENNYRYTQVLAHLAQEKEAKLIYASSAATYGDGAQGYSDQSPLLDFRPLNPYGWSKYAFDLWAEAQGLLKTAVGLKFFNVYGPNERHKGDMRSVVSKSFDQILATGQVKLFKSHNPKFADGEQLRDFVWVDDVVAVVLFFLDHPKLGGIYNCGTGQARSFKDLVLATYKALDKEPKIEYIDMPLSLQPKYQYFTEADTTKLREAGFGRPFTTLEEGVKDYVVNHLLKGN